jgi:regulator of protease activity HflC (stomatin/prohibitin superfamily)
MVREIDINPARIFKIIGLIIGILIVLGIVLGSFYTVGAGERGVILTFGNPDSVAQTEGLHFKFPIAQEAVIMDIKTQKYEAEASAASQDLQTVSTKIAVNYHLEGTTIPTLYKEIGVDYSNRIISPAVQETVKASTAKFTAEQLITKRSEVKEAILEGLKERLIGRGIIVEDISITNFEFSDAFNTAVDQKVTAEQQALTQKNKLAQVQYEAQQAIALAEGSKQAAILEAQGKAEAIRIGASAIKEQGGEEYIRLQAIQRWNGQFPNVMMSGNGATPLLDISSLSK